MSRPYPNIGTKSGKLTHHCGGYSALIIARPAIELANSGVPGFARIFKEMVLVTTPSKPLPRAGKGTVMRKQALALYADEVEEMYVFIRISYIIDTNLLRSYKRVQESRDTSDIPPPISWTADAIQEWLIIHAQLVVDGNRVAPSVSLFDQGFDR